MQWGFGIRASAPRLGMMVYWVAVKELQFSLLDIGVI